MIQENLIYDELKDNNPVDQYGFVDLAECISNGYVPDSISNTEDEYNDIEDPESIMGKPHDVFEAFRMQDAIKNYSTTTNTTEEE